jgi:TonB family protein
VDRTLFLKASNAAESGAVKRVSSGMPSVEVDTSEFNRAPRSGEVGAIRRELQATRQRPNSLEKEARALAATEIGGEQPTRKTAQNPPVIDAANSKPPVLLPNSRLPKYPAVLRGGGITGRVLVEFVVDSNGRADVGTFRVLKSDNELFTMAVREVLPELMFLPAEVHGRKVSRRLQLPFNFTAK